MPQRSNPKSLANLRQGGGLRAGIPNRSTRDIRARLDRLLFGKPDYWRSLKKRIYAGEAAQQECLLIQLRYGRPRPADEDDLPFAPGGSGDAGPQIIFNLPRPPAELEGRCTVVGAVRMDVQ